jgi:AcrR family transcriptional regulator
MARWMKPQMVRKRLSRPESRALTRERLLAAAREAFIRGGYARTYLEAVAEAAGFSKGAVYSNFESKEALFLELLEAKLTSDAEGMKSLVVNYKDGTELLAALRRHLEAREDILDFTASAVEFMTQLPKDSPAARRCASLYQTQREALSALVRALAPPLSARKREDAAAGVIGLTLGLATQRSLDRSAVDAKLWARVTHDYLRDLIREV